MAAQGILGSIQTHRYPRLVVLRLVAPSTQFAGVETDDGDASVCDLCSRWESNLWWVSIQMWCMLVELAYSPLINTPRVRIRLVLANRRQNRARPPKPPALPSHAQPRHEFRSRRDKERLDRELRRLHTYAIGIKLALGSNLQTCKCMQSTVCKTCTGSNLQNLQSQCSEKVPGCRSQD